MAPTLRILLLFLLSYAWPCAAPGVADRVGVLPAARAQESAKVWVNSRSGVYHCPGSRYYGNTKAGEYLLEAQARAAGNRPAYGRSCDGGASPTIAPQPLRAAAPIGPVSGEAEGVRVWVNTRSGVYHCRGSQYYGNTKAGQFMSEPDARAGGNRPAYGRTCG